MPVSVYGKQNNLVFLSSAKQKNVTVYMLLNPQFGAPPVHNDTTKKGENIETTLRPSPVPKQHLITSSDICLPSSLHLLNCNPIRTCGNNALINSFQCCHCFCFIINHDLTPLFFLYIILVKVSLHLSISTVELLRCVCLLCYLDCLFFFYQ